MAAMVLPLRQMTANAQLEAVSAKIAYFGVVRSVQTHTVPRVVTGHLKKLIDHQKQVIHQLEAMSFEGLDGTIVLKIADDLEDVVSLTNSFLDVTNSDLSFTSADEDSVYLDQISELNAHLDSYAESVRIAGDETCSALLASVARNMNSGILHK